MRKRQSQTQANQIGSTLDQKSLKQPVSTSPVDNLPQEHDNFFVHNLKKSVKEAIHSSQSYSLESSLDIVLMIAQRTTLYYFQGAGFSRIGLEKKPSSVRTKKLLTSQVDPPVHEPNLSGKLFLDFVPLFYIS
ncbi:hypothetical protein M9H77_07167 [Catharanthus roseus]|uniref:Uncharacterized protein n=1 Tax=Catharanthus roseus TaxID=4058 RepID=A0ACC0BUE6_CATRO|nr:hypothetical protein M9H77_07167 [Catharanthus roseus]